MNRIDNKMNLLLEGMDAQAKQLNDMSIDLKAVSRTLDVHEDRLAGLEEHNFGACVREENDRYKDKNSAK